MARVNPFGSNLFDMLADLFRDIGAWLPGNFFPLPFIYGTDKPDSLFGTKGPDTIFGLGGDDDLHGAGGNDQIIGGGGNDFAEGDDGNDRVSGGAGEDALFGGAGNDWVAGGADNDFADGGDGDDLVLGQAGNDNVWGGDGDDTVEGGDGNDNVEGLWGDDRLYGGAGNDILDDASEPGGIFGRDWYFGGDGDDRMIVAGLADALGEHAIDGGAGFDRLELVAANQTVAGIGLLAANTVGVEAIGLGYSANTLLIVNPRDVLDFSADDQLFITGGHDYAFLPAPNTSRVLADFSDGNVWTATGVVSAHDNVFNRYESVVDGQHVTLYVDTLLVQAMTPSS